jgi:hypothetical protein
MSDIFARYANWKVVDYTDITVETLYQAFKKRLLEDMRAGERDEIERLRGLLRRVMDDFGAWTNLSSEARFAIRDALGPADQEETRCGG